MYQVESRANLRFGLKDGSLVNEVEETEHLVGADLGGVPGFSGVDDHDASPLMIPVLQHVDDIVLEEGAFLVSGHEVVQERSVLHLELGDPPHQGVRTFCVEFAWSQEDQQELVVRSVVQLFLICRPNILFIITF